MREKRKVKLTKGGKTKENLPSGRRPHPEKEG